MDGDAVVRPSDCVGNMLVVTGLFVTAAVVTVVFLIGDAVLGVAAAGAETLASLDREDDADKRSFS